RRVRAGGGAPTVAGGGARTQQAWLVIDDAGIQRVDSQKQTLVDWREPFGVTVLASAVPDVRLGPTVAVTSASGAPVRDLVC
ncbi:MAG: hypothetical protein M3O36_13875, partial [Myxococcota bacterium]|nr:hypothetical protein [Myxococcota bacterium]